MTKDNGFIFLICLLGLIFSGSANVKLVIFPNSKGNVQFFYRAVIVAETLLTNAIFQHLANNNQIWLAAMFLFTVFSIYRLLI